MGIWGELKLENLACNPIGSVLAWDDVLLDAVLHQEGLELRLNTLVTDAAVSKGMIQFVETRGIRTESFEKITASVFVDCTGDGFIARLAGVPYRLGREDRACFGERLYFKKPISSNRSAPSCFSPSEPAARSHILHRNTPIR